MGRGTPLAQYGSFGGMIQPDRGYGSQQPMASNMRYTGPQQGSPNNLSYARGPMTTNPQGPGLGRGLFSALGQLQTPQQMPQQPNPMLQNLVSQLRGMTPQQPMISDMRYRGPQPRQDVFQQIGNIIRNGPPPQPNQPALTPAVMPQQPMVGRMPPVDPNMPYRPTGPDVFNPDGTPGTKLRDPDFNINTATNTFFKSLGDRVNSGQMSVADAQRAQAEMRALQVNPAGATREAATEIAQRNLGVGPYAPPAPPTPAAAPAIPQGWTTAGAYRDFGAQLGNLIKDGKITVQQANALKAPAFEATRLGNTPEAYAAMQNAVSKLNFAAGGYISAPMGEEDPRMQAMRAIQRIGK